MSLPRTHPEEIVTVTQPPDHPESGAEVAARPMQIEDITAELAAEAAGQAIGTHFRLYDEGADPPDYQERMRVSFVLRGRPWTLGIETVTGPWGIGDGVDHAELQVGPLTKAGVSKGGL